MVRIGRHFQKQKQKWSLARAHAPAPWKCPPLPSLTAVSPAAWARASSSCPSSSLHVGVLKAEEDEETLAWVFWLCLRVRGERARKVTDDMRAARPQKREKTLQQFLFLQNYSKPPSGTSHIS